MIQFRTAVPFSFIPRLVLGSTLLWSSTTLHPWCATHRSTYCFDHATHVQGATVELDFVGTGLHVFSATAPTSGSYEVYVDGKRLSEVGSSSKPDSQLLLGSITGLGMALHTVALVNSGVTGDILDLDRVEVESVESTGIPSLRRFTACQTHPSVHPCLSQLSTTPSTRFSGDMSGFLLWGGLLSTMVPSSTYTLDDPRAYFD